MDFDYSGKFDVDCNCIYLSEGWNACRLQIPSNAKRVLAGTDCNMSPSATPSILFPKVVFHNFSEHRLGSWVHQLIVLFDLKCFV